MKRSFLISTQPASGVVATIFAAGALNPVENLDEVAAQLRTRGIRGKVLFDLLLSQGNKVNRFVYGSFDGNNFSSERLVSAQDDYQSFAPLSAEFLHHHLGEVDASLLSTHLRYAVRKGIPI